MWKRIIRNVDNSLYLYIPIILMWKTMWINSGKLLLDIFHFIFSTKSFRIRLLKFLEGGEANEL